MSLDPAVALRPAGLCDAAFIVEMARHACIIEDWPLPAARSVEVQLLLPSAGEVPIVAVDDTGIRLGAVWTFHHDPPLLVDSTGASLPELCLAVAPGVRGKGVGGALLDALLARNVAAMEALCANVHLRNPAQRLYERKGFQVVGRGRGPLGIAMHRPL